MEKTIFAQMGGNEHPEQPSMDELAQTIRKQLQAPRLRN